MGQVRASFMITKARERKQNSIGPDGVQEALLGSSSFLLRQSLRSCCAP